MPDRQSSGFTLIELLVVIAILSLLLAILLPSLHQAQSLAQRVICMGNLKQHGAAMSAYASENRRFYPSRENWSHLYRRPPWSTVYAGDANKIALYERMYPQATEDDGWVYTNTGLLVSGEYIPWDFIRCPASRSYVEELGYDWNSLDLCTWGWGAQSLAGTNMYLHSYSSHSQGIIDAINAGDITADPDNYKVLRAGQIPGTVLMTDYMLGRYGVVRGFWHGTDGANTLFVDGSGRWIEDPWFYEHLYAIKDNDDYTTSSGAVTDCLERMAEAF